MRINPKNRKGKNMKYAVIPPLFVIGSVAGYVIEVFYRRFVSQKKWMNPGFMTEPYLPIYGTGVVAFFVISNLNLNISIFAVDVIVKVMLIGVIMTLIEFIAGLIFI